MRRALTLLISTVVVSALATGCSSGAGSDAGTTSAPTTTSTTKADYADLDPTDVTFHAVREIVSCDGGGIPGDTASTTAVTTSSTVPSTDGDLCYVLGPKAGDATDLRDAKVYADGVGIEVAVRQDSVEALNELFDACYEATEACPAASTDGRGYVAIVVDGRVVSTPASNDPELASSPLVITGDFDKAQATDIAAAINGI
jgi:preprotein translocase subunit SecD